MGSKDVADRNSEIGLRADVACLDVVRAQAWVAGPVDDRCSTLRAELGADWCEPRAVY
jgi:hypothetical protein